MLESFFDRLRGHFAPASAPRPVPKPDYHPDAYAIPVLMVRYFPVHRGAVDIRVTGDVGASVESVRSHTTRTTEQVVRALEAGSAYHRYRDPGAEACLHYTIVDTLEYLEPLPTRHKPGHRHPMTDYGAIMARIGIRRWVEEHGVREVWLWGYHGGVIDIWESNMAGPRGDISNSDRDPDDLPVLKATYTVYHYNYQRGASEAVEDHVHQIEAILNYVNHDLFWNRFVGRPGAWRCGWAHYPPNAERDYDWANKRTVWSDIEDWRPDGGGQRRQINCARWNCDSLGWFVYWMQNLPGAGNSLTCRGRPLTNWWTFIGDFDRAMATGLGLVG